VSRPPEIRQMSPAVRWILGGVLFIGTAVFIVAVHRPARSPLADIKASNDTWWLHQAMPTPAPTPHVIPTPALRPIIVQQPPRPTPAPPPHICQICMERMMRYYKAIETGMGGDTGSNVRELPIPGQVPTPVPNIFAYTAGNVTTAGNAGQH
jgi:hypothetical protein